MPQSSGFGRIIIAETAAFTVLSAIFLGLRLYCKVIRRRGFWWDDYVLIAAWVSFHIYSSFHPYSISRSIGDEVS